MNNDHPSLEELQQRYASSLWLASPRTTIEGPIRNNFDPEDLQARRPQRCRITIASLSGQTYSVDALAQDVAILEIRHPPKRLIIFPALFGDTYAQFAVVSDSLLHRRYDKSRPAVPPIPPHGQLTIESALTNE